MHHNGQWDWLLDDWQKAVRRSLIRAFTRRQIAAMRWQWRLGQTSKWGLMVLPFFLIFSYLDPKADRLLLEGLVVWSSVEALLIATHVALGLRYDVSYSWAFHHGRPLLLSGLGARMDIKIKALFAALFASCALLGMVSLV